MTFSYFYGLNGEPLAGKIPTFTRLHGEESAFAQDRSAANSALNAFLEAVRLSTGKQLRRELQLPGGTIIRMKHVFGAVEVDLFPPNSKARSDQGGLFAGIVITLNALTNEDTYLNATSDPAAIEAAAPMLPEVGFEGRQLAPVPHPGRPAVAGPRGKGTTTHLILQISDKPFGPTPVKSGVVKIWRAKELLVGRYPELHYDPKRYILTASNDLSEFYFCGQKVTGIPAMPSAALDGANTASSGVRVRTHGFNAPSWDKGASARGVVIVAAGLSLYAVDATSNGAMWKLLDKATWSGDTNFVNTFGKQFTTSTDSKGITTIICSGSNGAGVCSGFTVTISPTKTGRTITGVLSLMSDGSVATPASESKTFSLTADNTVLSQTDLRGYIHWGEHGTNASMSYSLTSTGATYQWRSRLSGEVKGSAVPSTRTTTYSFSYSATYAGVAEEMPGAGWWRPAYTRIMSINATDSSTDSTGSTVSYTTSAGFSSGALPVSGGTEIDTTAPTLTSASGTVSVRSGTPSPDKAPVGGQYPDELELMYWEYQQQQSSTVSYSPSPFGWAATPEMGMATLKWNENLLARTNVTTTLSVTSASLAAKLARRDLSAPVQYADVIASLPNQPAALKAHTYTSTYETTPTLGRFLRDSYGISTYPPGTLPAAAVPSPTPIALPGVNGVPWSSVSYQWLALGYDGETWGIPLVGDGPIYWDQDPPAPAIPTVMFTVGTTLNYSGTVTGTMTYGELKTAVPAARYLQVLRDVPDTQLVTVTEDVNPNIGSYSVPVSSSGLAVGAVGYSSYAVTDNKLLICDPRSYGFVAELQLMLQCSPTEYHGVLDSYIGNNHSCVPLMDVINEWRMTGVTNVNVNPVHPFVYTIGSGLI